jgi:hypothetical protein
MTSTTPMTCGEYFKANGATPLVFNSGKTWTAAAGCKRRVAHSAPHGTHKQLAALARRTTSSSRKAAPSAKPMTRTIDGVKYVLTPVVTKARKARRPKVRVIPMADSPRLVAAARRNHRTGRFIKSGTPRAARPAVG